MVFFFFASSLCKRPLLCYLTCGVWPFLFLPELHSHALGWKYLCNVSFGKYTLGRACFSVHNVNLVHRHVGWSRVRQVGSKHCQTLIFYSPSQHFWFPPPAPCDNVSSVLGLHWDAELSLICHLCIWKISWNRKVSELWEYWGSGWEYEYMGSYIWENWLEREHLRLCAVTEAKLFCSPPAPS